MRLFENIRIFFLIPALFLVSAQFYANNYQTLPEGPIHEAFITQENGDILLESVPIRPPADIQEESPTQGKTGLMWIPGYWAWSKPYGDYIWVSGVWRKPPPGRQWVSGYWKRLTEGWVWFQGFWSETSSKQFNYISEPPFDLIDENVLQAPSPQDLYFWIPGYWKFDPASRSYSWLPGKWEILREHWIYVPAHYLWRENGFIFIQNYWDYTLENRGIAYASIYVNPEAREDMSYHPSEILQPIEITEILYPYWPNYSSFFRHHFYFHRDLWVSWGGYPPWWNWSSWWCFTWPDSWWLWWWWTHPGYPNPPWLTEELATKITRPPDFVLKVMQSVVPPQNVTTNGVVGNSSFIKALQIASGKPYPILPSDPKQVLQIQELAKPSSPKTPYLEPKGIGKVTTAPKKPFFGYSTSELKNSPNRIQSPPPPEDSRINLQEKHETTQNHMKTNHFKNNISHMAQFCKSLILKIFNLKGCLQSHKSHISFRTQKINIDIDSPPAIQGPPEYHNAIGPTSFFPGHGNPPHPYAPEGGTEVQGSQLDYMYVPMHMQHHEHILFSPLYPPEEPPGPNAHQLPGDYSTIPEK